MSYIDAKPPQLPFPGPGVVYDMPAEQYHRIDAVSSSLLKILDQYSPMHAKDYVDHGIEETDAMWLGTVAHALVLEPLTFPNRFVVGETCEAMLKTGVNAGHACGNDGVVYSDGRWLCGVHGRGRTHELGREVVTAEEMNKAKGINFRLHEDREADRLLCGHGDDEGRSEVSMFAVDPVTGLPLKIRMDRYLPKHPVIADLKKCQGAGEDEFGKQIEKYRLHVQAGFYCYVATLATGGVEHKLFEFIAVEEERPHAPACWLAGEQMLSLGIAKAKAGLDIWAERLAKGSFPSYHSHQVRSAPMSNWFFQREARR